MRDRIDVSEGYKTASSTQCLNSKDTNLIVSNVKFSTKFILMLSATPNSFLKPNQPNNIKQLCKYFFLVVNQRIYLINTHIKKKF